MRKTVPVLVALLVGLAGTAMAVTIAPLTSGGRTLAGPGKTALAANITETVYTHVATNTDACATVINSSRASAAIRITLVGPAASTVTLDVAAGTAATLCHDGVVRMDLSCIAETACTTEWRIDNN